MTWMVSGGSPILGKNPANRASHLGVCPQQDMLGAHGAQNMRDFAESRASEWQNAPIIDPLTSPRCW